MQPRRTPRRASQLLAATFLLTTGFPLAPVFAEGTQAGTSISNTANVTYRSPRDPGTTINATSNTVSVQVAEVAGITVTASGVTDVDGGQVEVGDTLYYTYSLTNVGNDPTSFRIPNLARVTGPGTPGTLEYSIDGGATWTAFPGSELLTNTIPSLANGIVPGGSILVRVPVTIAAGAQANDVVSVTLGDTPGDAQNQARSPNGGDVYTVDNPDGTPGGEVTGAPVNGVREASSTAQATVNQTARTYALATLLKTRTGYTPTGAPGPGDDQISYGLSLRVENTDPTGLGITPAPLAGTTVNGVAGSNILVSDAIPLGTTFVSAVAPLGWQTVYTSSAISIDANQATWSTTPIANPTRVGFVRTGTIAPGTTVTGFQITVAVAGTPASITVANIGQLFGSTPSQTVGQPGVPVYDESGDQNPSNYSDDGTPPGTDSNGDGVPDALPDTDIDDGFVNTPASPETGIDSGNNNSGQDSTPTEGGGEASVFTLNTPVPAAVSNGPDGAPTATGPSGTDNDDFTNASSPVPPNLVAGTNATLDPAPVAFTNTVLNSGTSSGNIVLTPQPPATLDHLPANSTVTITAGSSSVTYQYDGAGNYTIVSSNTGGNPIQINNVQPGQQVNYGVEVNLPLNTPLSTDINRGFPVPIQAGIDTDSNIATIEATNLTIDRVYTGYLRTVKESRILPGTGPAPTAADSTFSTTQKTPAPGNVIEYRITYTNISEPQSGTGNIILEAEQVVIDENGVSGANNTNNWARDNDGNGIIDTSNIVGSAADSGASTVNFFSGNPATTGAVDQTGTTATTDVTRYVNTVTGIVAPQQSRTFTFRRRVN
ncbi:MULTISPECIES: hypothetical protein [Leptolyngbya]|uniref:DUF7925 domain-containing protein n=1 Tax=Leptolyngbya TaxID=47251 RepID=UPI00168589A5|nr:hypothetical protein [Leptolyngbya sp. FACHB-1624]MBD1854939.1 hypothetical protein [Leptolyngbya sp. FACHB-1624]